MDRLAWEYSHVQKAFGAGVGDGFLNMVLSMSDALAANEELFKTSGENVGKIFDGLAKGFDLLAELGGEESATDGKSKMQVFWEMFGVDTSGDNWMEHVGNNTPQGKMWKASSLWAGRDDWFASTGQTLNPEFTPPSTENYGGYLSSSGAAREAYGNSYNNNSNSSAKTNIITNTTTIGDVKLAGEDAKQAEAFAQSVGGGWQIVP
jgi:hypothetical protein